MSKKRKREQLRPAYASDPSTFRRRTVILAFAMGNTPIKLKISAAVHPLGAPMPLINRSNLTTCAMRYPIAHRPLTCPQNEERTKNQLHDGLYHNILCMSSFHFKILYLLQTGLLVNDSIQQVWPPSCKFVGYTTAFSILYQFKIL